MCVRVREKEKNESKTERDSRNTLLSRLHCQFWRCISALQITVKRQCVPLTACNIMSYHRWARGISLSLSLFLLKHGTLWPNRTNDTIAPVTCNCHSYMCSNYNIFEENNCFAESFHGISALLTENSFQILRDFTNHLIPHSKYYNQFDKLKGYWDTIFFSKYA